jgi:hypothetical protein
MGDVVDVNEPLLIEFILPASTPFTNSFPGSNSDGQSAPALLTMSLYLQLDTRTFTL